MTSCEHSGKSLESLIYIKHGVSRSREMSVVGQCTQSNYIIQGVGDEVLLGVSVFFSLASILLVALCVSSRKRAHTLTVHPSAREHVETVRQNEDIAQRSNRENLGAENCPICLAEVDNPVETNCAHVFCGMLATQCVCCSLDSPRAPAVFQHRYSDGVYYMGLPCCTRP